jgi:hypothetical protein
MMAIELLTCRVAEDPVSPVPVGAYMVACVAFHE